MRKFHVGVRSWLADLPDLARVFIYCVFAVPISLAVCFGLWVVGAWVNCTFFACSFFP